MDVKDVHSAGWKDILSTRDLIHKKSCYTFGNGKHMKVFRDVEANPNSKIKWCTGMNKNMWV